MRAHRLIAARTAGVGLLLLAAACRQPDQAAATATQPDPAGPAPTSTAAAPLPAPESAEPSAAAPASTSGPEGWLGQWNGPEGTSLVLAPKEGGGFLVTITTLDGSTRYEGDAAGPGIVFERDGETETIRAGSGKLTGMKWLSDKADCLVIKVGEGYCRD